MSGEPVETIDPADFVEQPARLLWKNRDSVLALPGDQVEAVQLESVRKKIDSLRPRLPLLDRLATEQGVSKINRLNDAAPLLFKHSVYKSYPLSLIEKNRFDRLTSWLGNLTTADLSGVKTEGVESIDDWLDALLRDAGVRIIHSTGTSGKLSFLPRSARENELSFRSFLFGMLNPSKSEQNDLKDLETMPLIVMGYRKMFNGYGASLELALEHLFKNDESMIVTLEPGRLSADVLSLAGRLAAAEGKGGVSRDQVSPALLAKRQEIISAQKEAPARRAAFFKRIFNDLRGKPVLMTGSWAMFEEMMQAGAADNVQGLFSPESRIMSAGGSKGKVLPPDFKDEVKEFLGVEHIAEGYGMSELSSLFPKCEHGNYHALPWIVLYVLDPETGLPAPRSGTHTGRFGAIDLAYSTRWGGILSGDEVTVTFGKCACGRDGPVVHEGIRRYSEKEGGDDKITCAGAPEAHDNALAFLSEFE